MLDTLTHFALAVAFTLLFPSGVDAARPCAGANATFQYPMGDVRYDGPDPAKNNRLSTIAASLQASNRTPLYECVAQWPEEWGGWYENGDNLIWGDCIFTGAGLGQDETVSFAVDWKERTMYLAHTFVCSDQEGAQGLATGSINLDFNCTTTDGSIYCIPESTETGTRPALNIATKLVTSDSTSACANSSGQHQSWRLENWLRRIEMQPGSSPTDPKLISDSGPSFSLRNLANGGEFTCAPSAQENGTFVGACKAAEGTTGTTADFVFDTQLNMLEISQHWQCEDSSSVDVVGVGYMQAACSREFNSDQFTCTSLPVWIGTGVV